MGKRAGMLHESAGRYPGLGRHRGGSRQPRADGCLRACLRTVRRDDQHRRCARADGHGEVGSYPRGRPAPSVAAAWRARHGRDFAEGDVDAIFQVFEPMNIAAVRDHADIIPGCARRDRCIARARHEASPARPATRGRSWMCWNRLAAAAGYVPELTVCAGDLPAGRPTPLMMWYAMAKLGVWPAASVVKVDDTAPGIGEGKAAATGPSASR